MSMRIITAGCLLGLLSLLSISCEDLGVKTEDQIWLEGEDVLVEFTIDPVDNAGYHLFKEETFEANLDSLAELYDFSIDRIESVVLVGAEVEITGPGDALSLDYLDMLKITIYTASLGEVTIAENLKIPDDVKKVELDVMEGDLKDYLVSDEYVITVYGTLNSRTYQSQELEARIKYKYSLASQ